MADVRSLEYLKFDLLNKTCSPESENITRNEKCLNAYIFRQNVTLSMFFKNDWSIILPTFCENNEFL